MPRKELQAPDEAVAGERAKAVIGVLTKNLAIPADRVTTRKTPARMTKGAPYVKITVLPAYGRP
jgi:hypothetical protein